MMVAQHAFPVVVENQRTFEGQCDRRRGPALDLPSEISPESRFVIGCVREPAAVDACELRAVTAAVRDWDMVVQLALRHRVTAYVCAAADRDDLPIPAPAARTLRHAMLVTLASVMQIDVELRRVVDAFNRAEIPIILLKGPALVRTIYPDPSARPYSDIDLTVQEQHLEAAVQTLLRHGYIEQPYAAEVARREHFGEAHAECSFHRQFTSAGGRALVDLHTDPLQLGIRPSCEADRWRRTTPVPHVPGALMLGPEDQLVQLSAHVHKHGYDRLIWLKDLDALLRTYGDTLDWRLVEDVAREEGLRGSVWYGLHLAQWLLAAPVPPAVLGRLRPSLPLRVLYQLVWPVSTIADLRGFMRRRAVQFHAAESWRGVLPGLILMGRRGDRAQAALRALVRVP